MKCFRFIIIGFAVIALGSASLAPREAHAQLVVNDPANLIENTFSALKNVVTAASTYSTNTKEYVLDPIAWMAAKMAIQQLTKSTLNWINSGFNGSPSFVTNLPNFLQNVGDVAAGSFLNQLASNASIHSPFQSMVAQTVGSQYYLSTSNNGFFTQNAYTLNQVTSNDAAFLAGDFSQGGWDAWYSATMNPQNNPYGARINAEDALNVKVADAKNTQLTQLGWGQGFLSWCGNASASNDSVATAQVGGGTVSQAMPKLSGSTAQTCTDSNGNAGTIQTPGTVIQGQLEKTLGSGVDQLVSADEFDEIVGALASQLMSHVLGGEGLGGVSSASSGGSGYIDQASDPSQYSSSGATINSGVASAITTQIQQVQQYQTDWNTILGKAQLAKNSPSAANCGAPTQTAINSVLSQGQGALTKTASALTLLQKVANDVTAINNAGSSASASDFQNVGDELQQALASPSVPSATDMAYAHQQAQDTAGEEGAPSTLYTEMENIAGGQCVAT